MWQWLMDIVQMIGKVPLCNKIPERAPHIFGHCFILCYRCTFILLGFFITLYIIKNRLNLKMHKIWVLFLPMILDGSLQTITTYESSNPKRILTGLLFGIALAYLVKWFWQKLDIHLGLADNKKDVNVN